MAAYRTHPRSAARCSTAALPDNRLIAASAILSVAVLLLMLLAGTAKAEEIDFVCYDMANGELGCETVGSIKATCALIGNKNELCEIVRSGGDGARLIYPGNTRYTVVKLGRASLEQWHRDKPHTN